MRMIMILLIPLMAPFLGQALGTVLIADTSMSRMVELTTRPPYCQIHRDRGQIRSMLLRSDPRKVRQMSDASISKLLDVCGSEQVTSPHQGGFIYPGTKWCGPGSTARNFTDLGMHRKEDMCCREHDNCPNSLMKGECKQGICNDSPFTRSHCDCDATFRRCLQNVNSETANTIGAIFFNVVQVICFKERSPCSQWQSSSTTLTPTKTSESQDCPAMFYRSGRYMGATKSHVAPQARQVSTNTFFTESLINTLFRKLKLL